MLGLIAGILAIWLWLWVDKEFVQPAARRTATERKEKLLEEQRHRQANDDCIRDALISWALGVHPSLGTDRQAPPIEQPKCRQEVIRTLRNREVAIQFLKARLDSPSDALYEYQRFLSWFEVTEAKSELSDRIPLYLLQVWADGAQHPLHSEFHHDPIKTLRERFELSEQEANKRYDRFLSMLP